MAKQETQKEKKKRLKAEAKAAEKAARIEAGEEVEDEDEDDDAEVYTYVGAGDTPPRKINFMGLQKFTRGQATKVTNETVLAKIKNNPCFVEGEVDMDELDDADEEAAFEADKKRQADKKADEAFKKKHHGE